MSAELPQEAVEAGIPQATFEQMVERFMWAVSTGPGHPDATAEKAVLEIVKPLLPIRSQVLEEVREGLEKLADPEVMDTPGDTWGAEVRWREAGWGASVFDDDTEPDYIDLISDAAAKRALSSYAERVLASLNPDTGDDQ